MNGNVSKILKQSLKDFQQTMKLAQHDGHQGGANAGLGIKLGLQAHQTYGGGGQAAGSSAHHAQLGHAVNSTKAAKRQSLVGGGAGSLAGAYGTGGSVGNQAQMANQYSHRAEEMGFLNKLTQQNLQGQPQPGGERRDGAQYDKELAQQASNRGLQAMYLGSGVGSHAPNAKQISLNSPKYGQAHLSFMSQGMAGGNHPSSPGGATAVGDSYHFQNDSLSSQFNRTGPIILNNRPSISDPHFYN